jgi:aerobic carbon-monoxide dehydrogenase small subunit
VTEISLTVNGKAVRGTVEPRTHLADFLRDQLRLTATHLRCEQGVCGVCTVLIDGQPARSCITYAVLCEGGSITTLEGLQTDDVIQALLPAFVAEHGLQCGFCTPAMLITARDIITRLPDANESRVRLELSGNLCRCTGYAGIVRAICHVLAERRGMSREPVVARNAARLGPVGARKAVAQTQPKTQAPARPPERALASSVDTVSDTDIGLGNRQANFEKTVSFTVTSPADELWVVLADVTRIASCMPGASLSEPPSPDGRIKGLVAVKFGPIATSFSGTGLVTRDDAQRRGILYGAGRDRFTGSSVRAEVAYALHAESSSATRLDLTVRALLAGPLAQFGRSGVVQDLIERLARDFAGRLEHNLATGEQINDGVTSLSAGSLLLTALRGRVRALSDRLSFWRRPRNRA